jgi:hypothetical protein
MIDFSQKISKINSKEDFINFVGLLVDDLKNNPDEWENKSLPAYLDAIARWTDDMEGYYLNNNIEMPKDINWVVFANILMAAKIYE